MSKNNYSYVDIINSTIKKHKNTKTLGKQFTLVLVGSIIILGIGLSGGSKPDLALREHELVDTSTIQVEAKEQKTEAVTSESIKTKEKVETIQRIDELGVFVNENNKADLIVKTKQFLAKYSPNSPVEADLIVETAQANNFALDLVLTQGQLESNWCTKGRAVESKQCLNIGAYDAGDTKQTSCTDGLTWCNSSYKQGLEVYYKYMLNCHFRPDEKPTSQRFVDRDFRIIRLGAKICSKIGGRYATSSAYLDKFVSILQNQFNPIFQ